MPDRMTLAVPIFGVDPHAHAADGTPRPIDRAALQRIADTMTRKMQDTGWRVPVTSGNTPNPGDDKPEPEVLGHIQRVWVEGDRLLADVEWDAKYVDQIPIRRWMTPELWTDRKTGKQWIDPVVAHATREEIRRDYSWLTSSTPGPRPTIPGNRSQPKGAPMLDKLKDLDASDIQEIVQLVQAAQTLEPLIDAALATAVPWIQKLREPIEGFHDWQASLDVKRFKTYLGGGMTADQAVALMVHRDQQIAHAIANTTKKS